MVTRFIALALLTSLAALAQTGQITGLITDPAGSSVPGAAVAVINVDTGIRTGVTTNDQG